MRSKTTSQFRNLLSGLPAHVQRQANDAYGHFKEDPTHPGLQFKRVNRGEPAVYSVRVGLQYRALGVGSVKYIVWFWIGTHADYDRLIEKL